MLPYSIYVRVIGDSSLFVFINGIPPLSKIFSCSITMLLYLSSMHVVTPAFWFLPAIVKSECVSLETLCCVELLNHLALYSKQILVGWLSIKNSASSLLYYSAFDVALLFSSILLKMPCAIHLCLDITSILGNVRTSCCVCQYTIISIYYIYYIYTNYI